MVIRSGAFRKVKMAKIRKIKPQTLVTEQKYQGKYIAYRSLNERKILASSSDAGRAMASARKKGVSEPVVVFVPNCEVGYMY